MSLRDEQKKKKKKKKKKETKILKKIVSYWDSLSSQNNLSMLKILYQIMSRIRNAKN